MLYKKIMCIAALGATLILAGCDDNSEIISQYKETHSSQNEKVSFKGYNVALEPGLANLKRSMYMEKYGFPIYKMLDDNLDVLEAPRLLSEEHLDKYNAAKDAYRHFITLFTPRLETSKSSHLRLTPVDENADYRQVSTDITRAALSILQREYESLISNPKPQDPEIKELELAYKGYLSSAEAYNKTLFRDSLISSGYMFTEFESDNDIVLVAEAQFDEETGDLIKPADKGLAFYIFTHGSGQQDIFIATLSTEHDKKTLAEIYSEAQLLKTDVVVKDIADIFAILEAKTELMLK